MHNKFGLHTLERSVTKQLVCENFFSVTPDLYNDDVHGLRQQFSTHCN